MVKEISGQYSNAYHAMHNMHNSREGNMNAEQDAPSLVRFYRQEVRNFKDQLDTINAKYEPEINAFDNSIKQMRENREKSKLNTENFFKEFDNKNETIKPTEPKTIFVKVSKEKKNDIKKDVLKKEENKSIFNMIINWIKSFFI
ncbi:MAG: hypothetical protein V4494_08255 [Chlamydiota bacterium]